MIQVTRFIHLCASFRTVVEMDWAWNMGSVPSCRTLCVCELIKNNLYYFPNEHVVRVLGRGDVAAACGPESSSM